MVIHRGWLWAGLVLLAGCAGAPPTDTTAGAAPAAPTDTTAGAPPVAPTDTAAVVPPAAVAEAAPESLPEPPALNLRCQVDADCTVKNIGNCCGFLPACVNQASPTAPDLVLARCAQTTDEPNCDHPMIYACLCEQGICRADPSVRSPGE